MKNNSGMAPKRLRGATNLLGLLFLVVALRYVHIQVVERHKWAEKQRRQSERTTAALGRRGVVRDARGRELALTVPGVSVFVDPSKLADTTASFETLQLITGVEPGDIGRHVYGRQKRHFVWVARSMDLDTVVSRLELRDGRSARALKHARQIAMRDSLLRMGSPVQGSDPAIGFVVEEKRYYPFGRTACHVLGFAGVDNQGLSGVELAFDSTLKGEDGLLRYRQDSRCREIKGTARILKQPINGTDIALTIDVDVQRGAEYELERSAATFGGSGSVIVMDAGNGSVMALCNEPAFDLNRFKDYPLDALENNLAIRDVVTSEAVSVLLMTLAGVQSAPGLLDEEISPGVHPTDCLHAPSRINDAVVRWYERNIGSQILRDYSEVFGIGERSGVRLPGEEPGKLVSSPSQVPGTAIFLTPLQLVGVMALIANEGVRVAPKLTKSDPDRRFKATLKGTSDTLKRHLIEAVERGEATSARIQGYAVGGMGFSFCHEDDSRPAGVGFAGLVEREPEASAIAVLVMVTTEHVPRIREDTDRTAQLFRSVATRTLQLLENQNVGGR